MSSETIQILTDWYRHHCRALPWRENVNPYRVWISEMMLQQTRIDTVIRYFSAFMDVFPSVQALSSADLEQVYTLWEGLGYYQRAKHIWKTAKILTEKYHSTIPPAYESLIQLPGIGDYTACAILSIAFNLPFPAVDGNVLRVVTRLNGWTDNVLEKPTVEKVRVYLAHFIPKLDGAVFTESWMELGETICLAQQPKCPDCPLSHVCIANRERLTDKLPVRIKNNTRIIEKRAVFIMEDPDNNVVMTKKEKGLLAELWELPNVIIQTGEKEENIPLKLCYPGLSSEFSYLGSIIHDFTHKRWIMHIYRGRLLEQDPVGHKWKWIPVSELHNHPMASAFKKIFRRLSMK